MDLKFLVDENLSEALLPGLLDGAPGSIHVRLIGAGGSSDLHIWQLAAEMGAATSRSA